MGGAATGGGGVADANLNLVPFIDLLSCLICFLLISAVWTQMARIDVDQALPRASSNPKEKPQQDDKINVLIAKDAYLVNISKQEPKRIPKLGSFTLDRSGANEEFTKYDRATLRKTIEEYVEKIGKGATTKVVVAARDDTSYIHLIGALDVVLGVCPGAGGKECLKNPSVGDPDILRAEGFTSLE